MGPERESKPVTGKVQEDQASPVTTRPDPHATAGAPRGQQLEAAPPGPDVLADFEARSGEGLSDYSGRPVFDPGGQWGEWMTGGGCTALGLTVGKDSYHCLITEYAESQSPERADQQSWMGVYDPEGQCIDEPEPMFLGTAEECAREGEAVIEAIREMKGEAAWLGPDQKQQLLDLLEERGWKAPDFYEAMDNAGNHADRAQMIFETAPNAPQKFDGLEWTRVAATLKAVTVGADRFQVEISGDELDHLINRRKGLVLDVPRPQLQEVHQALSDGKVREAQDQVAELLKG